MPQLPFEDPLRWFSIWMEEARQSAELEPTAMSLATVDRSGQPRVRIVLLKALDDKGVVFYTNLDSRKGEELAATPRAGLNLFWKTLGRQVRLEGEVEPVTEQEADAYFATRPRGSQIGAWASRQSRPLEDRETLAKRVAEQEAQFAGEEVKRPGNWSGFRVVPQRIEFWQAGPFRLHDRWEFLRSEAGWEGRRLYP